MLAGPLQFRHVTTGRVRHSATQHEEVPESRFPSCADGPRGQTLESPEPGLLAPATLALSRHARIISPPAGRARSACGVAARALYPYAGGTWRLGLSEVLPAQTGGEFAARPRSVIPGLRVILDTDDAPFTPGRVGDIVISRSCTAIGRPGPSVYTAR